MKIERKLRLSIPNPCDARAEHMTPTSCGSFCHLCRKEVVDFSAMTDTEILSVLRKNTSICGSFLPEQLDRDIVESYRVRRGFPFRLWAGILSFVAMLQLRPANAQVVQTAALNINLDRTDSLKATNGIDNKVPTTKPHKDNPTQITGELVSDTIPHIKYQLKGRPLMRSEYVKPIGFFGRTWGNIKGFFTRIF